MPVCRAAGATAGLTSDLNALARQDGGHASAEDATQRGDHGTAIAGSVASAIKFIARGLLTGKLSNVPER